MSLSFYSRNCKPDRAEPRLDVAQPLTKEKQVEGRGSQRSATFNGIYIWQERRVRNTTAVEHSRETHKQGTATTWRNEEILNSFFTFLNVEKNIGGLHMCLFHISSLSPSLCSVCPVLPKYMYKYRYPMCANGYYIRAMWRTHDLHLILVAFFISHSRSAVSSCADRVSS